jgi:hypothetical protein
MTTATRCNTKSALIVHIVSTDLTTDLRDTPLTNLSDRVRRVRLWQKGLLTAGGGLLAVIVSFMPGAGPCGPSTPIGTVIMMLGLLALPIGAIMLFVGLVKASI